MKRAIKTVIGILIIVFWFVGEKVSDIVRGKDARNKW